jgi:hypothetical protein
MSPAGVRKRSRCRNALSDARSLVHRFGSVPSTHLHVRSFVIDRGDLVRESAAVYVLSRSSHLTLTVSSLWRS